MSARLTNVEMVAIGRRQAVAGHPHYVERVLVAYRVGLLVSQLMPLDLSISLGELAHKYRSGAIVRRPFEYTHISRCCRVGLPQYSARRCGHRAVDQQSAAT